MRRPRRDLQSTSADRGHADAGPAADAGVHADILLAVVLIREHVADDPGWRLELPQLLAVPDPHGLDVAFERAIEHDAAGRPERAGPHRELLGASTTILPFEAS